MVTILLKEMYLSNFITSYLQVLKSILTWKMTLMTLAIINFNYNRVAIVNRLDKQKLPEHDSLCKN